MVILRLKNYSDQEDNNKSNAVPYAIMGAGLVSTGISAYGWNNRRLSNDFNQNIMKQHNITEKEVIDRLKAGNLAERSQAVTREGGLNHLAKQLRNSRIMKGGMAGGACVAAAGLGLALRNNNKDNNNGNIKTT